MKSPAKVSSIAALLFSLPLLFAGCRTAPPQKSGGVELFNGRNFSSWTFCMQNHADPMKTWSVENGVIHCIGRPHGYMRTNKRYHDYRLTVVWRFVKVAPRADNSGIFVHIQPPDKVFPECIECQGQFQHQGDFILSGGASADGYPAGNKAVFIHQHGPPNEKPVGEWNTNRIICRDHTVTLIVNGRKMNEITGCNLTSGCIGVQSEGGEIEVRKLFLEPLK
jgi:3-keto-disaccharide hydrolase